MRRHRWGIWDSWFPLPGQSAGPASRSDDHNHDDDHDGAVGGGGCWQWYLRWKKISAPNQPKTPGQLCTLHPCPLASQAGSPHPSGSSILMISSSLSSLPSLSLLSSLSSNRCVVQEGCEDVNSWKNTLVRPHHHYLSLKNQWLWLRYWWWWWWWRWWWWWWWWWWKPLWAIRVPAGPQGDGWVVVATQSPLQE